MFPFHLGHTYCIYTICCNWKDSFYVFCCFWYMNLPSFHSSRPKIEKTHTAVHSTSAFSFMSAQARAAEDKFIFSQTFYLITVPSHLLVLPLPVCYRGNPSFVSQGSSANWENLNLSSELKQLEHIWLRRVTTKCISQHSRLVIT